jgi:NAD(P)-dependent dehydrogenase (short-subunit alcohol dehydrogenase family)
MQIANEAGPPPTQAGHIDPVDLAACLRVLVRLSRRPALADDLPDLGRAVARAYKAVRRGRRKQTERNKRSGDRVHVESTGRCRQEPRPAELSAAGVPAILNAASGELCGGVELTKPRSCYVCKRDYRQLHPFYHLLCPACAVNNYARRSDRADLNGRRALVTGGRIKIGFQTALKLLRDGAEVIVTTRFPRDAARRYAGEADFGDWAHRLRLHGLDLRDLPGVCAFADDLAGTLDGLDVLVNNAAQTIRREPGFFASLYERERSDALPAAALQLLALDARVPGSAAGPAVGPVPDVWHWPDDLAYDAAGRPRDPRPENSWLLEFADVAPAELAEVMLVNAMAPFVLCARLEPLMQRSRLADRYIVNVSAMEGRFGRGTKTSRHPHTNMAKAALNMLTRTAAGRLAEREIYMNSVDTGWVTEENPHAKRARLRARGFVPPLDEVDGAARVYDPIIRGIRGTPVFGLFLKDYSPVSW